MMNQFVCYPTEVSENYEQCLFVVEVKFSTFQDSNDNCVNFFRFPPDYTCQTFVQAKAKSIGTV